MENNKLKEKIRENIKEEIAISNIIKEQNINNKKHNKVIFGLFSACALVILCIFISKNTNLLNTNSIEFAENDNIIESNNANIPKDNIVFNDINKLDIQMASIDGKFQEKNIIHQFEFLNNIYIPEYMSLIRQGELYVKENSTSKDYASEDYTKLRQYCLWYSASGNENPAHIEIIFTKEETILDDCINPDVDYIPSSIISGKEITLFKSEYLPDKSKIAGAAFFEVDGYKISIETTKISENEFINLIKSMIF